MTPSFVGKYAAQLCAFISDQGPEMSFMVYVCILPHKALPAVALSLFLETEGLLDHSVQSTVSVANLNLCCGCSKDPSSETSV